MSSRAILRVEVGPAVPAELPFVLSSWKKSFRHAPQNAPLPNSVFFDRINPEINALASRCDVLVARDESDPLFLYGFLAYEVKKDAFAAHYVYTRHGFRRQGVAKALLAEALDRAGDVGDLFYTAHTRFDRQVEAFGLRYTNLYAWSRR